MNMNCISIALGFALITEERNVVALVFLLKNVFQNLIAPSADLVTATHFMTHVLGFPTCSMYGTAQAMLHETP